MVKWIILFTFAVSFFLPSGIFAIAERELGWPDLVKKVEFEDPFEKLTSKQIFNLGVLVRTQEIQKDSPERITKSMIQEAKEAENTLREESIDIDGLIAKREEIRALRKQRAYAVVSELDNQSIKMPGYALPLEMVGRRVTEFLLVPWVGACIHTPPPPPNQIVHVKHKKGFETQGLFQPVWVHGRISTTSSRKNLYLRDGSADIDIGYALLATTVKPYKK